MSSYGKFLIYKIVSDEDTEVIIVVEGEDV